VNNCNSVAEKEVAGLIWLKAMMFGVIFKCKANAFGGAP
jgi:hypothetical protein